jgi:hypothetical protein
VLHSSQIVVQTKTRLALGVVSYFGSTHLFIHQ